MKVNISNYEVWMIDYFDGKLNAVEIAELMAFVEDNPEIKEEFKAFENIGLENDDIGYQAKTDLKKDPIVATANIHEDNYEEYFIAFHEGDLSESEHAEILAFVDLNPSLKNEFTFHGELLINDPHIIIYEDKAGLKHKAVIGIYWQIAGIAAAILFLFGLFNQFEIGNLNNRNNFDNRIELSGLLTKSINVDLKSQAVAEIIKKEFQLIEFSAVQKETERFELIAFQNIREKSPDINVAESIDYVRLAEHKADYFDISQTLALHEEPKRKNAFGRVIQNLSKRVTGNLPVDVGETATNDPTFVKALGRTITVFNTITGSDTELVKAYDQNGNLTKYYVEGETIAWSKDIVPNSE